MKLLHHKRYSIEERLVENSTCYLHDIYLVSNDEPTDQPFPRWHNRTNEYEFTMIEALLDFVNATSVSSNTTKSNLDAKLTDHNDDVLYRTTYRS